MTTGPSHLSTNLFTADSDRWSLPQQSELPGPINGPAAPCHPHRKRHQARKGRSPHPAAPIALPQPAAPLLPQTRPTAICHPDNIYTYIYYLLIIIMADTGYQGGSSPLRHFSGHLCVWGEGGLQVMCVSCLLYLVAVFQAFWLICACPRQRNGSCSTVKLEMFA